LGFTSRGKVGRVDKRKEKTQVGGSNQGPLPAVKEARAWGGMATGGGGTDNFCSGAWSYPFR